MAKAKTLPFKIYVKTEEADGTTWLNAARRPYVATGLVFIDWGKSYRPVTVSPLH